MRLGSGRNSSFAHGVDGKRCSYRDFTIYVRTYSNGKVCSQAGLSRETESGGVETELTSSSTTWAKSRGSRY